PVRRSECRPLSVGGRGCRSLSLHDALPILLLAGLGSGASLETSGETTRLPIAVDRSMRSIVADPPAARFRRRADGAARFPRKQRSEEHTSNSSHQIISYAVFCLQKKSH